MDKCPFCGSEITETGKFCGSCGHPLTDTAENEPISAPEAAAEVASAPEETIEEPIEAVAPAEPAETPADAGALVPPPQPPQAPVYGAAQQPAVYAAPQQNYGAATQTVVKKNKKGMILAIAVGVVVVLGLAAALVLFFSGGSGHSLDGEYKLTGLKMGDQDYSSYISYIESGYNLTIDGSDCTIAVAGNSTTAKIDQAKHLIYVGEGESIEFTVEGEEITLEAAEYSMTFTRQ